MNRSEAGKLGYQKAKNAIFAFIERRHAATVRRYENKKCARCAKAIPYEKRYNDFCSRSCSAITGNEPRRRFCCVCSLRLEKGQRKFCSYRCSKKNLYDQFIVKWLSGEISGGHWAGVSKYVKRWLIEKRGDKCERCGWCEKNPITNKVPIQVDHADGNPENHRPENIKLLCPNCHSLTPTYGGLNRGRGRKMRYARD